MRPMTEDNQKNALSGESQAHLKYLVYSDVAQKEGYANVSRLFKAIAYAELVHARNHLKELGGIGNSSVNLQAAIDGENFEVDEMYPAYQAVAVEQNEKGAQRANHYALEAEKIHAAFYTKAKQSVDAGKDISLQTVQICDICGYTAEGDAPEKCPVCGAPASKFTAF